MDIVLGVSMAPTTVRLVLIEGQDADGVTVEEDAFETAASGAPAQVIDAIVGTREGATEGGYQLTSTGVTWTDPAEVGALREAIASHDVGSVMLVSPLLAAAALAQTVGQSIGYQHIAMLFIEPDSATLAVVDATDGSITDLHRRQLVGDTAVELSGMVAGLDAPGSEADGVFVVGCGAGRGSEVAAIKAALEAATTLAVSVPEEPDMALARGAALASANAPLFAVSTAALAYSLDPGTGEVNPRALSPTYLEVSGNARPGALAYSALDDAPDDPPRRRFPMLVGSALAAVAAVAAGVVVVSLTSDAHSTPPAQSAPRAVAPANRVPPPEAQVAAPSPAPAAPAPAVAAPASPAPEAPAPPAAAPAPAPVVQQAPVAQQEPAPPPRRAPTRRAPESVPSPVVQQAPAAPPPAAPPPEPAAPPPQYQRPPLTMYLHLPFVTVPIPINPPPPPPPPAP